MALRKQWTNAELQRSRRTCEQSIKRTTHRPSWNWRKPKEFCSKRINLVALRFISPKSSGRKLYNLSESLLSCSKLLYECVLLKMSEFWVILCACFILFRMCIQYNTIHTYVLTIVFSWSSILRLKDQHIILNIINFKTISSKAVKANKGSIV